ncbi:hypothetical protein [Sphingobacterium hotanense]|uniref:hypothetical protein n=1 Tax=Sphingobacterium hotanense TaxID=649196 RepID=UPI0011F37739|nr:hypothetical protein [Sphingobacterium hotanense]
MLRVDLFIDKFEGLENNSEASYYEKLSNNTKERISEYINLLKEINRCARISSFIKCWHINTNESIIMWDAYSNSNGGIAIKSTVGILKRSNIDERPIYITKVNYIDEFVPIHNTVFPLVHERVEFSDEREFRILHQDST